MPAAICTICHNQRRHAIELALVHRTPLRVIADRYGVSKDALYRHRKLHLTAAMKAALLTASKPIDATELARLQKSESENMLATLQAQRARLQVTSDLSVSYGNFPTQIQAERAITGNLELTSKLLGMITQHHSVEHVNLLVSPSYLELRAALVAALRRHPEAAADVARVLHQLEAKAAADITARAGNFSPGKNCSTPLVIEHQSEEAEPVRTGSPHPGEELRASPQEASP
jgi:hypothetical protein